MRLTKRISITLLATVAVLLASFLFVHQPAHALFEGAKGQAQCGVNLTDNTSGTCTDTTGSDSSLNSTLRAVLNILSVVAGIIAVIMLIIAGIRFITSQGDSGSTASARNTVIYAIIGLVVVVLAQFIVYFVIGKTSTATNTQGSTVQTTTNPDGSITRTITLPDGTVKTCNGANCSL